MKLHANAALSLTQRRRMVLRMLEQGWSIKAAAAAAETSSQICGKWVSRYREPIRIWSRVGRRPLLAAGKSNGEIPMLEFTRHEDKPCLSLLLLHDDADREFDYTSGAEQAPERADANAWTVVSIRADRTTVSPHRRPRVGTRSARRPPIAEWAGPSSR
ncbi:MAG TPA: helix-turn-helix domain-containing protein [Solirubrobacteraceae bacterium]|nr:helix-turn-helix domain-containing protein [Solirubrobacteraceae bacterium]